MSDNRLRCALIYRLGSGRTAVCVAKYDHAGQYETHGGADSSLYGGRDQSYAEAVAGVVSGDPPSGLSQSGTLGGFKVVQSDQHQVVYGADSDGLCKCIFGFDGYLSMPLSTTLDRGVDSASRLTMWFLLFTMSISNQIQAVPVLQEPSTPLV